MTAPSEIVTDVRPQHALRLRVLDALASARRYGEWISSLALLHLGDHSLEIGSGLAGRASGALPFGQSLLGVGMRRCAGASDGGDGAAR